MPLGILELVITVMYLIPRTAVLGALLLTGYLGGAVAAHLRINEAWIVQFLLGVTIWGGLYFRDARIRELIPVFKDPKIILAEAELLSALNRTKQTCSATFPSSNRRPRRPDNGMAKAAI